MQLTDSWDDKVGDLLTLLLTCRQQLAHISRDMGLLDGDLKTYAIIIQLSDQVELAQHLARRLLASRQT